LRRLLSLSQSKLDKNLAHLGAKPEMDGSEETHVELLPRPTQLRASAKPAVAWQAWRFVGVVVCCTSQKVTTPVFPVTSAVGFLQNSAELKIIFVVEKISLTVLLLLLLLLLL
jgi:hypothetical protein